MTDADVIVIGAGAAGLFAATEAAGRGARTLLLEKNRKAGVKVLASGGTKCNVTSTLPVRELGRWFGVRAERFLRHALHACTPDDVRAILAAEGVGTGEFHFEKVFPRSGRASDVLEAFLARLHRSGAELALDEGVTDVRRVGDGFEVDTVAGRREAACVIVTSGGRSYPKTGCTGDGYGWVERLGHTLTAPRPALVPLVLRQDWIRELSGIAVTDAVVEALDARGRAAFKRRRQVLFTHRGLSGPGPMDVSGRINADRTRPARLRIDWLPDVSADDLEATLREGHGRDVRVADAFDHPFPRRLVEAFLALADVPHDRRMPHLARDERRRLVEILKRCVLEVDGDEGWDKAEVTAGGVSLDEVSPKTMESRIVPGLFLAGEILDYDGPIGGFNFQAAFSTGTIAGQSCTVPCS